MDPAAQIALAKSALMQIQILSAGAVLPYIREINTIATTTLVQMAAAEGHGSQPNHGANQSEEPSDGGSVDYGDQARK
jgi:hypothetical protein